MTTPLLGRPGTLACPACGHHFEPCATAPLTPRQRQVLTFVEETIDAKGFAPSFAEIRDRFGFASDSTVFEHLKTLEAKGYITRGFNLPRAITVVAA